MSEFITAKSYQHMTWDGEPFKENSKMYVIVKEPCGRCGGHGFISAWGHIDNGVCFDCGGSGTFRKKVRLYSRKEIEAKELAAQRKEEARIAELEKNSEKNKQAWMEKNGFGADGLTWCVFGDDTFAIKDFLKESGCKFSPLLKWHAPNAIEVPEGYGMVSISFDEIFSWNPLSKDVEYKENAKEKVERVLKEAEGPSESDYVGTVGERVRNVTAIFKSVRGFSGAFGWTNIYTFESEKNVLVWFTAKELDFEKGAIVDFTGTVKKHEEFRGVKTTQFSRCIIKAIQ